MTKSTPWLDLSELTASERRTKISDKALARREREITGSLSQGIQELRELLYLRGIVATDAYHEASKENLYTKNETAITPRVRWDVKNGLPHFYWERTTKHIFPTTAAKSSSAKKGKGKSYVTVIRVGKGDSARSVYRKVVLATKHIRLNARTDSIPPSTFQKEPSWSRMLGPLAEEQLTILRKQSKLISQINRNLIRLKELEKELEE